MNKQIKALKMAVREMTDAIPHLDIHFDDYFEAINACKEALAEARLDEMQAITAQEYYKQEPVSLGDFDKLSKYECVEYIDYLRKEIDLLRFKEWQSLSDNNILNLFKPKFQCEIEDFELIDFARAIEQTLKEKNHV